MTMRVLDLQRRRQRGFTLMEVLVTMVIMALGLLGFAALQAISLKSNRTALERSYATMYAYDIIDCMRANRGAAMAGSYNLDFDSPASGGSVAGDDMVAWKAALAQGLPNGEGRVDVDLSGNATVQVRWKEANPERAEDGEWVEGDVLSWTTQSSL